MPRQFDPYALPPTDQERADLEFEWEGLEKRRVKACRFAHRCGGGDNYYNRVALEIFERQQVIAEILARKPLPPSDPANLWKTP